MKIHKVAKMLPIYRSIVILLILYSCQVVSITIEEGSLRSNGIDKPIDIFTTIPRLSWRSTSNTRGDVQTAYQVQVATSSATLSSPDMWDTGKVMSGNVSTLYAGISLTSRSIGWWRVRVWDASDTVSSWSSVTTFELSLISSSDWSASWITNEQYHTGTNSLPVFAKVFNISCEVKGARLYLLGLGLHAAMVNGLSVTDAVLEPGYSTIHKTLWYSTYNISTLLAAGENVLGIELGKGIYDSEAALGSRYMKFTTDAQQLKLISQLECTCLDGSKSIINSDATWLTTTAGPRIESSWFGGEEYDARQEFTNYSQANGNRSGWVLANTTTGPSGILTSPRSPPLKIVETLTATKVTQVGAQWVFDFGVNFAGWFSLTFSGTGLAGTRIVFYPSEQLTSVGLADQSSTGDPIFDAYTFSGNSSETYTPKFMYHGLRYIQVNLTVTPTASDMKGYVIRASNEAVGSIDTSNTLFNSIHKIIDRAIQSNMYSVMTDCPHREKLGWLEEDHLVLDPVVRGYDFQAYGHDFVRTIADTQLSSGLIPDIAPEFVVFADGFRNEPNWGSTIILMPYRLYQYYGDMELLSDYYTNMQDYLAYLTNNKASGYLLNYGLGDWVTTDSSTPLGVTSTFGYQQSVSGMVTMAAALGKSSDVATYETLNANIKSAFHEKYFNTTNNATYCSGSQACNAIALDMGAVPAAYESEVVQSLVDSIVNNKYHLTVGEIALPSLFRALQANNRNDIIFNIMSTTTSTSYGYQVVNGATSLWEHWDGTGGSLNHFMLGYADNWLMDLSGLTQSNGSVAWMNIDYRPIVVGDLTAASSSYRTPRGKASASWSLDGQTLTYIVDVPVGAMGTICLNQSSITESGNAISPGSNGILSVTNNTNSSVAIQVGSGRYTFKSTPP